MTTPTNHFVIVTIPGVKRIRGRVLSVKQLTPRRGVANLQVETYDRVQIGVTYEAVYHTPSQEAAGTFQVLRVSAGKNYRWSAFGLFVREKGK
jgi:hypothetical protein